MKTRTLPLLQLYSSRVTGCKPRMKRFLRYNDQWVVEYSGRLSTFSNPYRGWRYFTLVGGKRYEGRHKRW